MNTFHAHAQRNEGWWSIQVEEEPAIITQTRRLEQIPDMVKDALELFPELTTDPHNDTITVTIDDDEASEAQAAAELNAQAKQLVQQASQAMQNAAKNLIEKGYPLRDIGYILGVSFQQAKHLADKAK